LAHDHEQAADLVDTPEVRRKLIAVLFSLSLILGLRDIPRHESALQTKEVLRCVSDMVSEVAYSLSEGLTKLGHLLSHSSIRTVEFFFEHGKSLAEPVDLRNYLLYSYLTHTVAPKSEIGDCPGMLTYVVTFRNEKELRCVGKGKLGFFLFRLRASIG